MLDFLILYKKFAHDNGVTVSVSHLSALLKSTNFSYCICDYEDDESLYRRVLEKTARVIILEAPTFQRPVLEDILAIGCEVNLVIHSTISFLQVEEEAFDKIQCFLQFSSPNFTVSNPCLYEVEGFRSYAKVPVLYFPNTLNVQFPGIFDDVVKARIENRKKSKVWRIGLFCAYRPFKNITTQLTACSIVNTKYNIPIEVHLFEESRNPIYKNIRTLSKNLKFNIIFHPQCKNEKFLSLLRNMDIGMQVSYSETFSYVMGEHMMFGTPTISSSTVPFASRIAEFNNAESIAKEIAILCDDTSYSKYVSEAVQKIDAVRKNNNIDAMTCLNKLLERSKTHYGKC